MRSLVQFGVVAVTLVTLTLAAAVGVSAHSGTFGSQHATSVSIFNSHFDLRFLREGGGGNDGEGSNGHGGHCDGNNEGNNEHHDHGTPGHKHHPCGNKGDDTD